MNSSSKSAVPKILGRYSVEKLIGEGGMAQVYLGHAQSASGFTRPVALKILLPHLRGDPDLERMLISEARWGGKLQHDGLAATYELGLHEGSYFVCMEYVEGVTLRDLLAASRLPSAAAIYFVSRLALVLDYVHTYAEGGKPPSGLVHRDLKPSNIMLTRAGQLKLLDFGIAKATQRESATRGNVLKGSYAYMSPEQLDGKSLDARSDLFSLGSLLFELLTGRRAFDGATIHETMRRVRDAEVLWPPEMDQEHRYIVASCLKKNPEERVASALELYRALASLPCDFGPLDQRALLTE